MAGSQQQETHLAATQQQALELEGHGTAPARFHAEGLRQGAGTGSWGGLASQHFTPTACLPPSLTFPSNI